MRTRDVVGLAVVLAIGSATGLVISELVSWPAALLLTVVTVCPLTWFECDIAASFDSYPSHLFFPLKH